MASALDDLKSLSSAEDFFRVLDVEYEPRVLAVARLHILRRMGETIASLTDDMPYESVRMACREALAHAYAEFTAKAPIDTRLFKVLKDRDPARPERRGAFVPLSDLTG
jgi:nitrogenase-stabilizing/protective protein